MPLFQLDPVDISFPPVSFAEPDGLLAVGGDLRPKRLIEAYKRGIFPWFNPGNPILWWSPDPRMVLFPNELKVAKSMRPYFNQNKFEVSYNQEFKKVIYNCQHTLRDGQPGTWITAEIFQAYIRLHELGVAHSVEVWKDEELVGGLYGLLIGKVFFGESMFSKASNASKFGFISLVRKLVTEGVQLIDCQQETSHLKSLGARTIPREDFIQHLKNWC